VGRNGEDRGEVEADALNRTVTPGTINPTICVHAWTSSSSLASSDEPEPLARAPATAEVVDRIETSLKRQVCGCVLTLAHARRRISLG
jgi:hypothetical protein